VRRREERGGRRGKRDRKFVLYRIEAPPGEWDRLAGELHSRGTLGIEERPEASPPQLLAYFDAAREHESVGSLTVPDLGILVHPVETQADEDWTKRWREGLSPRRIGPIWIRPSWCAPPGGPELELDPERAFGSGEHATTRLALRILLDEIRAGESLLDVGTGSGILLLAALRVRAERGVGVDVDPVACSTARSNALRNRLGVSLVCGTLDAIRLGSRFDVVVANLLLSRLEPWLPRLAAHASRRLILSGYLEREWPRLQGQLQAVAMVPLRTETEVQSGETWCACSAAHSRDLQSSSKSRSVVSSA
jgi:ribosomal protein L11 methyltransferase